MARREGDGGGEVKRKIGEEKERKEREKKEVRKGGEKESSPFFRIFFSTLDRFQFPHSVESLKAKN